MISRLKPYPRMKHTRVTWFGVVPAHWTVARMKSVASILNGATPSTNNPAYWEGDILWLTPDDLGALNSVRVATSSRKITQAGYTSCATSMAPRGSVVISTRAPIGHLAILDGPGCVNQGCRLLVLRDDFEVGYAYYMLLTARQELQSLGVGTTFNELSRQRLGGFPFALPPPNEQTAIARFLDHMDRRIQKYIRAKEKLVALLDEYKQALIHQAVTGQIDVRTGKPYPEYKESGVEWLPRIPAHWQMKRSKRVYRPRKELAEPDDIQLSATQAFGVIGQEDYENRIGRKIVKISLHLEKRRHVEPDDFVISMRSFQGGLERAWVRGCIRSSYVVLRPATEVVVPFFGFLFKSAGYISALQATANFIRDGQDLNFDNFCRVDVPFPPLDEQRRIAQVLDRTLKAVSSAIDRTDSKVNLLRKYRTRLIADVVTGKLDVRETATALPYTGPKELEATPARREQN